MNQYFLPIENQIIESELNRQQNRINSLSLEDNSDFQNQFINQPIDLKNLQETVQEYVFTDEKLEMYGIDLSDIKYLHFKSNNIKILDLTNCRLKSIPDEICNMNNLQKLYLANNMITNIPNYFESLIYLSILDISQNQIQIFNIPLKNLRQLNISFNYIEIPYLYQLDILNIQNNKIQYIPKQFLNCISNMTLFEFEWFKYCKPPINQLIDFKKQPKIHLKLKEALQKNDLYFVDFINLFSVEKQNFKGKDIKDRNLYFQAGLNDEIGVIQQLYNFIASDINNLDYKKNTALSFCYKNNQIRSIEILKQLGGQFSSHIIHRISQKADVVNLQYFINQYQSVQNEIQIESIITSKNKDGNTPLHELMMNFDKYDTSNQFGLILLQYNIDANIENNDGYTPLQMAVKNKQIKAIQFAYQYNQSEESIQHFDFNYQSNVNGYNVCHIAVITNNMEILQYLQEMNVDIFCISKVNKYPKHYVNTNQAHIKLLRNMEIKWLNRNIILKQINTVFKQETLTSIENPNVWQLKNQIEINNANQNNDQLKKYFEQEEIEDIYSLQSYNEFSLQVGSECLVKDVAAESIPLNLKKSKKQNDITIQKYDELKDYLPESMKLLRNGNIESAINKYRNALSNINYPVSEKVKYKNQLIVLKFRFKQKQVDFKIQLGKDVSLILNEYQFQSLKSERRKKYFKELSQMIIEENKKQLLKAENIIKTQRIICSSFNLNKDLTINNSQQIKDYKNQSNKNLVYDITNYGYLLFSQQEQIYDQLYSCNLKSEKILIYSNFFSLQNYEYLQQMKFKRRRVLYLKEEDIEKDMQEHNSLPNFQIINNNNLFCNSKRF